MTLDLSKWAVLAHNDDTGFGRGALDLRAVLGIDRHLIIPSEKLSDKPKAGAQESFLDPGCSDDELKEALSGLQGIIFFERPNWHPNLLYRARELSIATVCIVTWEWFKGHDRIWDLCDLFVCPSEFSLSIVRKFGRQNSIYLPWSLALSRFPARSISGPARLFVHNAGLVDPDDRKGTLDTIEAFKLTRRADIKLIVRMQKEVDLPALDDRITVEIDNLIEPAELYRLGDVAIQPSKLEGIGFMILEAVASGMPVITLDYPPMNEMVRQKELLIKKRMFARKSYGSVWVKQAHLRLPDLKDLTKKIEWCAQQDMGAFAEDNRAWAERTFQQDALRAQWCTALKSLLAGRMK
jgi:glycosyltransferase involved in cell wall biosynthesis